MKIVVEQEKLAKALNNVSRIVAGGKTTLPILNNVLIRVDAGKATLTTTNLDMAVVDYLPVIESVDGVITAPARLMAEFVSNLPKNAKVEIEDKDKKITLKSGNYKATVNGVEADDFPEMPEVDEKKSVAFVMGVDEFRAGLSEVLVATSNDTSRPALTGVFYNTFNDSLFVAATDGYRLADRKIVEKVKSEVKAIVPTMPLNEAMRAIQEDTEEVEILFNELMVQIRVGEVEITSKLIDGSYPDYRQLIPKNSEENIEVKKEELVRTVKLAALFSKTVGGTIKVETDAKNGKLRVLAVANEMGENASEIETKVEKDEKITLNAKYLLDALNCIEEESVIIGLSPNLAPMVVKNAKSSDYTHIIMPLNV
ncbi:DNA polymerase III subunit beta [Candidatus Saccharibacteria bacterium]|nr:DNA polymerase III subunit beta [Candidatus Saccharibacteria bacterium]